MTSNVKVVAHPFKSNDGRDLEVSIKLVDTKPGAPDKVVQEYKLQNGQEMDHIVVYEGRKVVIEEVPKSE